MNTFKKNTFAIRIVLLAIIFTYIASVSVFADSTPTNQSTDAQQESTQIDNSNESNSVPKASGLYKVDNVWRYFENGKFKKVTGLVQRPDTKTWHYVLDGVFVKETGLVKSVQPGKNYGKWYYVEKGTYTKKTGLALCIQPGNSQGKYYYVLKGDLNRSSGLVQCIQPGISYGKWYYVHNGRLNKDATGLVQCIQPGISYGKYYYVENSKLKSSTGLTKCIQPGESKGKYYYVKSGKLNKYTGIVSKILKEEESKKYYVKNGKYNKYTGTVKDQDDELYYDVKRGTFDVNTGTVKDRFYQNPDWMVQITQNISTHGHTYYVSPIQVTADSTRDEHVQALINRAYDYLGDPYVWCEAGAPGKGVDCMGLVMQACFAAGIDLYPSTPWRMKYVQPYETRQVWPMTTVKTIPFKKALPGDLIFYKRNGTIYHVAIYLGNDKIIHAYPGKVQISSVYGWGVIAGAKRVFY